MANSLDAFVPELWANESILILEESMVIGNLVHRDFEPLISKFGDVVNTRKPSEFETARKVAGDNVTTQDAIATNIQVPLNQHAHVSFVIKDGEESISFKSLVDEYLRPAMLAQARFVDQCLLGQAYRFQANMAGKLGLMTKTNATDYIIDARKVMNVNKAYEQGRNLIWTPAAEAEAIKTEIFLRADSVGDGGTAMQEASMGRKLGFNHYMCQNASYVATGNTAVTGAVNLAAGYAKGIATMTVDGLSAAITNGTYFTVGGDMTPQRVVSTVGGATPTSITFTPGLRDAVVDNAVITLYTPGAVNLTAGYAAGWSKAIVVNGFTVAPQRGQLIAFGDTTATAVYSIVGTPTTTSIVLDRPLDAAIADTNKVNIGPAGSYNFAFHKNALALVVRPLVLPRAGAGALGAVVNDGGLSMRVVIAYDALAQGHRVTFDMLMGLAVLDVNLGCVVCA